MRSASDGFSLHEVGAVVNMFNRKARCSKLSAISPMMALRLTARMIESVTASAENWR
jgi:hypothetical protein